MRRLFTLAPTFLGMICLCACQETCIFYEQDPVVEVQGPSIGSVDQPIDLTLFFQCHNGCGEFSHFEETPIGDTILIDVIAKYEGCICPQDTPTRQVCYSVSPPSVGTYYLKFRVHDREFVTDTLIITR